jgi:hypothetical protein
MEGSSRRLSDHDYIPAWDVSLIDLEDIAMEHNAQQLEKYPIRMKKLSNTTNTV